MTKPIPDRVKLDPDFNGFQRQVIGWASEKAPAEWPEYRRADLPPTFSACLAHPEIKALVEAAEQATDMLKNCTFQTMYMRGQYVDREEVVARAREALARLKDAKP
jgi:hypothetical protein